MDLDNLNMCLYQRYKSSLGHFGYKSSVDKTQKCEDKQEGGACPTWSNIFWPINPTFIIKLNLWHLPLSHLVRICSGKYTEIIKRISKSKLFTPHLVIWMWLTCTNSLRAGSSLFIFQLENIQMWNRTYS